MRKFKSGSTRNDDTDSLDYEGFLSPLVLQRYAQYMHSHRKQADGKLRASDNWQSGIPVDSYMKSMWRHFMDVWKTHRGFVVSKITVEEALCALLFNVMGMLHERLKTATPTTKTFPSWVVEVGVADQLCGKYGDIVLPDEDNNCSLCGSPLDRYGACQYSLTYGSEAIE